MTTLSKPPKIVELTAEDLEFERWLLDLALQPLDKWDGFANIEQYGGGAFRYQLNFLCYALALGQYSRTPAFSGYLSEAQANLIEKMRAKRVWSYWSHENLIAFQSWNPDPVVRENIMYTAFFALMVGIYETLHDDRRFSAPGALSLRWNDDTVYPYEYESLCQAMRRNMEQSRHSPLYPCEPRLIYPLCNTFSINSLLIHDRLYGSDFTGDFIEKMKVAYRRFGYLRKDGRFNGGKGPLRLTLGPSVVGDASMGYWLRHAMPEQAERSWQIVRDKLVRIDGNQFTIESTLWEKLDLGNYTRGEGMTTGAVAVTAREHGDTETAEAAAAAFNRSYEVVREGGARRYTGVSVTVNAAFAQYRFGRPDAMRALIAGEIPHEWKTGPILAEAAYPDVLVARAVTDGRALDLVLRPGNGGGRTTLGFQRLVPGREYAVQGAVVDTVTADAGGRALIEVDLDGRREVVVRPVG